MRIGFFKAFQIMGILSEWLERAIGDGMIDAQEITELIAKVMTIVGVKVEIKVDGGQ